MYNVWVLTEEHNDYNQYGKYFLAVFNREPTENDLVFWGYSHFGRENNENQWVNKEKEPLHK